MEAGVEAAPRNRGLRLENVDPIHALGRPRPFPVPVPVPALGLAHALLRDTREGVDVDVDVDADAEIADIVHHDAEAI